MESKRKASTSVKIVPVVSSLSNSSSSSTSPDPDKPSQARAKPDHPAQAANEAKRTKPNPKHEPPNHRQSQLRLIIIQVEAQFCRFCSV